MAVRQFRQIRPVDFEGIIEGTKAAGASFRRGFDDLGGVVTGARAITDAGIDRDTEANTMAIRSSLEGIGSIDEFNQAKDSGAFDISTLATKFGNRFDQDTTAKLLSDTQKRLKGEATASTIKDLAAQGGVKSNEDILKVVGGLNPDSVDVDAVTASLKSSLAGARSDKAAARADVITGRQDKEYQDKQDLDEALTVATQGYSVGSDPAAVREEAGKNLSGQNKIKFMKESREAEEIMSAMTPEQKADYDYQAAKGQDELAAINTEAQNTIGAMQTAISKLNPISEETAQHFSDVADPGGSVRDWFGERIGKHDWDIDNVNVVYRRLTKDGSIDAKDAAGIMVEAWRANEDVYTNLLGKGLDVDGAWERDIEHRVGLLKDKREQEKALAAKQVEYQTKIQKKRDQNRDLLFQQKKGTRISNKTGGRIPVKKTQEETTKEQTKAQARSAFTKQYLK